MNITHDSILCNISSLISAFVLDLTDKLTRVDFLYASACLALGAGLRRVWNDWT